MMLTLVHESHPALRVKCPQYDFAQPFTEPGVASLDAFILAMGELMRRKHGLGLAAPQLGRSLRLFVMSTGTNWAPCVNPIILTGEDRQTGMEECLSFPGLKVPVMRARQILCRWQDETGKEHMARFEGIQARIFQHELDHLEGIVLPAKEPLPQARTMQGAHRALAMKRAAASRTRH